MLTFNRYTTALYRTFSNRLRPSSTLTYAAPTDSLPRAAMINFVEHAFGIRRVAEMFEELKQELPAEADFFEAAFHRLRIKLDYDREQFAKIPQDGPIIFISNHAFGLIDGMMLSHFGLKARGNVKTFLASANSLVRDDRIGKYFLPVDFRETKESIMTNIETKRTALSRLREGGAIVIFPSGGTATAPWVFDRAVEGEWKLFSAKMIQMTKATVIPTFFPGQNSFRFHLANKISVPLRYALVVHEMWRRRNSSVRVEIGDPIPFEQLAHIKGRRNLLEHIRGRVYDLKRK